MLCGKLQQSEKHISIPKKILSKPKDDELLFLFLFIYYANIKCLITSIRE